MTTDTNSPKKRTIGIIGIVAGFLALASAFLSPWIQDAIDPPAKPIEEAAVDFAARLAEAAKAKLKGEEYVPATDAEPLPSRFLVPGIIGLGMLAAGLGILSLIKSEPRMVGSGAIALGVSAAVVQWSIMIAGVIIFLLIVFAVMSFLGG
ncbi:MAG: hypothetical protein HKN82_08260 [Akkermansiaceae bacterium]|nr:hypothetical protein [Akkermansiaceae bacterium]NNM30802.1 hypothetical protein [Akkermansiaceae bacterium]